MKLLLDTHLLLWAAGTPRCLPAAARKLIEDTGNTLIFSAASLWKIAIKRGMARSDLQVDARVLRRGLLDNGYKELPIASEHAVFIGSLPDLHKYPFDRILIAATVEGITLLASDTAIAEYPGPIWTC